VSVDATNQVWQSIGPDWAPTTKLVALAMADVVNDMHGWRFWASVPKLAAKCGVSVRAVQMALRDLEASGWVVALEQRPNQAVVYRWDRGATNAPTRSGDETDAPRGAPDAPPSPYSASNETDGSGDAPTGATTLTLIAGSGGGGAKVNGARSTSTPSSGRPNASSGRRAGEGHRLPNPWPLTDELREVAASIDDRVSVERQHAGFCDYWWAKAGKDARKVDWVLTWRNWIRRESDDLPERVMAAPERAVLRTPEEVEAALERMRSKAAQ
jgi:hypothetical protein